MKVQLTMVALEENFFACYLMLLVVPISKAWTIASFFMANVSAFQVLVSMLIVSF